MDLQSNRCLLLLRRINGGIHCALEMLDHLSALAQIQEIGIKKAQMLRTNNYFDLPKDQVDPLMQMRRHIITLKCLPVHAYEFSWAPLRPRRQNNIIQTNSVLLLTYKRLNRHGVQDIRTSMTSKGLHELQYESRQGWLKKTLSAILT